MGLLLDVLLLYLKGCQRIASAVSSRVVLELYYAYYYEIHFHYAS